MSPAAPKLPPYSMLSRNAQLRRLRTLARGLCVEAGLAPARLRLVHHGFNTTFRVRGADGSDAALRLNVSSHHTEAEVRAERAWVSALHTDGAVAVPRPLGELQVRPWEGDRPLVAARYAWLPGSVGKGVPHERVARALGETTGSLHTFAGANDLQLAFRHATQVLDREPALLGLPGFPEDPGPFLAAWAGASEVRRRLAMRVESVPLHHDLHLGNVMWHRGRLTVFDFDDALLGWPALDVGVTLFYLRTYANAERLESAYRGGLSRSDAELGLDPGDLETLVASRAAFLADGLQSTTNAELRPRVPEYLSVTARRLRHWQETGRFDPRVADFPIR